MNWGHASAQQLKRATAEAEGEAGGLIPSVDDVVRECEICRGFDVAPAIPVAGASSVASFNEQLRVDLLFWVLRVLPSVLGIAWTFCFGYCDWSVLRVLGLFSSYSLLSSCPVEESGRCMGYLSRFADCGFWETPDNSDGRRKEWKNDLWVDLRADG